MSEVLVVGEALVDVVSSATGGQAHPGGSPLNVAIGLARLGTPVTLATRLGTDSYGRMLASHLADAGVRLTSGSIDPSTRTSSATATIQADGSAHYDFDITWDIADIPSRGFDLVHAGSIGALLKPGGDTVAEFFEVADGDMLRSFDPNIRPSVVGSRASILPLVERFARASTIVKMSDEDAEWLHPELAASEVTAHYARQGASIVVITRGAEGSILRCGEENALIPSPGVDVADTIGAGDSYMAGLLHFIAAEIGVDGLRTRGVSPFEAIDACRFAAACAAVTVGRSGADLPHLNDVTITAGIRDESTN